MQQADSSTQPSRLPTPRSAAARVHAGQQVGDQVERHPAPDDQRVGAAVVEPARGERQAGPGRSRQPGCRHVRLRLACTVENCPTSSELSARDAPPVSRWYIYGMRTLYLLRHAKAADPATFTGRADIDRPLTERGRRDAAALGEHLRLLGLPAAAGRLLAGAAHPPDARSGRRPASACRPARRSTSGLRRVRGAAVASGARAARHRSARRSSSGTTRGCTSSPSSLADHGDDKLRARVREKLPTCAFVTVVWTDSAWTDLRRGGATLHDFVTPRDLV